MRSIFYLLIILILLYAQQAVGQVRHNYPVGSSRINCDTLHVIDLGKEEALKMLEQTTFRYKQEFKMTRKQGLQGGAYYLCGSNNSFLVVVIDDKKSIFRNVPLEIWKEFSESSDPENYYLKKISREFIQLD